MTHAIFAATFEAPRPETGIGTRTRIANALIGVVADSYVLMVKTQGYHWNVAGPLDRPIRSLTERHARDLFDAIDAMATRVRALGEVAPTAFTDLLAQATLTEEHSDRDAGYILSQLGSDHAILARRARGLVEIAEICGDGATEALAAARVIAHEEAVRALRAIAPDASS